MCDFNSTPIYKANKTTTNSKTLAIAKLKKNQYDWFLELGYEILQTEKGATVFLQDALADYLIQSKLALSTDRGIVIDDYLYDIDQIFCVWNI